MPPTIRIQKDVCGNIVSIETYQGRAEGPGVWSNILTEPIQRGDIDDLLALIVAGEAMEKPKCRSPWFVVGFSGPRPNDVCGSCGTPRSEHSQ